MKTIFLVLAITATVFAVTIEEKQLVQISTSKSVLRFNNYSGTGLTPAHIGNFTNFANSASSFYKDDLEANARYIKEQMDSLFGAPGQNFFVAIHE